MCDKIHRNNESTFCASGESTVSGQLESDMKVKVELYFHTREKLELSCSDIIPNLAQHTLVPWTDVKKRSSRNTHGP